MQTHQFKNRIFILLALLVLLLTANPSRSFAQAKDSTIKKTDTPNSAVVPAVTSSLAEAEVVKKQADIKAQEEQIKSQVYSLQSKLNRLSQQKRRTNAAVDSARKELEQLNSSIEDRKKDAEQLDSQQQQTIIQKADSIAQLTKKADTLKEEVINKQSRLDAQIAQLAERADSLEIIGVVEMKDWLSMRRVKEVIDSAGKLRKSIVQVGAALKIKSIFIDVKEGQILEVNVTVVDTSKIGPGRELMFRNKDAIMDFVNFEGRGSDKLYYVARDYRKDAKDIFLFLDDVMTYTPYQSFKALPYTDFSITLVNDTAKPKARFYEIKESTSINTYFQVGAYTDLKGLSGEPNALIQFDATAKFITRTKNLPNSAVVPFHYLAFKGSFAKFDNDYNGTALYHEDSISRRDLLQRTQYTVGAKLNLLRGFPSPKPKHLLSDWQLNIGTNFAGARVYDTLFKDFARTVIDTLFRNVTSVQAYVEPQLTISRHRNFSMTLTFPVSVNFVAANTRIADGGAEIWAMPGISLMYFGKRESGSKLFFRYNYFFNLEHHEEAFTQMQLGYSINLTDAWNSVK